MFCIWERELRRESLSSESANAGKLALDGDKQESYAAFETVMLSADDERPAHAQTMYPRHAVQDTEGGACHPELVVKDTDGKVYKGTRQNIDSYSAFFDNMKANDTGLCAMLEAQKVTDVYCCGLVFDICVMSTVSKAGAAHNATLLECCIYPSVCLLVAFLTGCLRRRCTAQNLVSTCQ